MMGQPEQSDDTATTREFTEEEIKKFYVSQTGDSNGKVPVDYKSEIQGTSWHFGKAFYYWRKY